MGGLVVESLDDISDSAPAGQNLEFDPRFGELERAGQGKPETQYGDTVTPAEPPDWKECERLSAELLRETRDLRILALQAVARLHLSGIPAYAMVMAQIRQILETRWVEVHPQLDPDDDNDPTLRANALFQLQDPVNVQRRLRDMPLVTTPQTGPVTWRDISVFNGTMDPEPGREKMTEAFIRGAFSKTNAERFQALRDGVDLAVEELRAIPRVFDQQAGSGSGPDFSGIVKMMLAIQKEIIRFEPKAEAAEDAGVEETPESGAVFETEAAPRRAGGGGFASLRAITALSKREDALYALELASSYFRTSEPSSPLPMLIERSIRLANMDFMDILRDLAPDGVLQAQIVAGPLPE